MNKLLYVIGLALLGGCASDPVEQFNEQQAKANDLAIERAQAQLDGVPEWYLAPPKSDSFGIVGIGASSSKDMNHAIKKAKLQAEFALAKSYKQELSGSERIYEREGASGELIQTSQFLIDKLVDSVPVVGYELLEQQVSINHDGSFQIYMMLKLPYDEFNKVLQRIKSDSQEARELAAFDDLERRLEAKRVRVDKELDQEHQRKIELMGTQSEIIRGDNVEASRAIPVVSSSVGSLQHVANAITNNSGV